MVSLGYAADGKRIRKKVSGQTLTEVKDKLKELHPSWTRACGPSRVTPSRRSLSNPMRHQAAWFFCDVTFVSMVAGGWLIQTLAGRGGGAGGRRNRLGLAA